MTGSHAPWLRMDLDEYDAQLDADPERFDVFEDACSELRARRDWKSLERFYRRQLRRLVDRDVGSPADRARVWRELGEVYLNRLGHPRSAWLAFEAALPDHPPDAAFENLVEKLRRDHAED